MTVDSCKHDSRHKHIFDKTDFIHCTHAAVVNIWPDLLETSWNSQIACSLSLPGRTARRALQLRSASSPTTRSSTSTTWRALWPSPRWWWFQTQLRCLSRCSTASSSTTKNLRLLSTSKAKLLTPLWDWPVLYKWTRNWCVIELLLLCVKYFKNKLFLRLRLLRLSFP